MSSLTNKANQTDVTDHNNDGTAHSDIRTELYNKMPATIVGNHSGVGGILTDNAYLTPSNNFITANVDGADVTGLDATKFQANFSLTVAGNISHIRYSIYTGTTLDIRPVTTTAGSRTLVYTLPPNTAATIDPNKDWSNSLRPVGVYTGIMNCYIVRDGVDSSSGYVIRPCFITYSVRNDQPYFRVQFEATGFFSIPITTANIRVEGSLVFINQMR